jgi:5-hydroxyisourate hydrolase
MITTHVLDTAEGRPAAGVSVILEMRQTSDWVPVGRGETDADGRVSGLVQGPQLSRGLYRLTFDTGAYHRIRSGAAPFFPEVTITFNVVDSSAHYHVPLLLSPYGYSTYRGS